MPELHWFLRREGVLLFPFSAELNALSRGSGEIRVRELRMIRSRPE
jgi:hypothetical protein